jgi:hypothetical protein
MTGTVGTASRMTSGSFDFRFVQGQVEFLLQQPDGGEIVIMVGATTLGARDRNATYSCDLIAQTCAQTGEAP